MAYLFSTFKDKDIIWCASSSSKRSKPVTVEGTTQYLGISIQGVAWLADENNQYILKQKHIAIGDKAPIKADNDEGTLKKQTNLPESFNKALVIGAELNGSLCYPLDFSNNHEKNGFC